MPDLSTAVGNRRSPSRAVLPLILHGTIARAVLPRWGRGTTVGCPIPLFPTTLSSMLSCLEAYALSFMLFLLLVCLVPGDDHPEQQIPRVNPGHATSNRYRTSESAGGSSSAPPPPAGTSSSAPKLSKKSASKPKGKTMPERTAKEFWARRPRNPYEEDQDPTLVNRPFWNRF